jgi:ADP-ribosylglycohydrolase
LASQRPEFGRGSDRDQAKRSAEVTHDHPEGIKGAQAVASAVFLGRTGKTKEQIKGYVETAYEYHHDTPLYERCPRNCFEVSCQHSVPQAIRAFLESDDFEHAVRLAISPGGDSDTLACMAGRIAQAFYGGVPEEISRRVNEILDEPLGDLPRYFTKENGCS